MAECKRTNLNSSGFWLTACHFTWTVLLAARTAVFLLAALSPGDDECPDPNIQNPVEALSSIGYFFAIAFFVFTGFFVACSFAEARSFKDISLTSSTYFRACWILLLALIPLTFMVWLETNAGPRRAYIAWSYIVAGALWIAVIGLVRHNEHSSLVSHAVPHRLEMLMVFYAQALGVLLRILVEAIQLRMSGEEVNAWCTGQSSGVFITLGFFVLIEIVFVILPAGGLFSLRFRDGMHAGVLCCCLEMF